MPRWPWLILAAAFPAAAFASEPGVTFHDFESPPHSYSQRTPNDRFTRLRGDLESGRIPLDRASEIAFLTSLLKALDIPVSSQALVFSTTSLQLRLITPSNPRAIFFNDEIYLGYIPGGRVEVLSLDPDIGAVFSIFDIPLSDRPVRIDRSEKCMNCHGGADSGYVPGLVMKSVVPGVSGGSLNAFRIEKTGHGIPFEQRFGGWYVTGNPPIASELANVVGRYANGAMEKVRLEPGTRFDFSRYPAATSDVVPQLLLEHQAGFVNRVVEATYRARTIQHLSGASPTPAQQQELDDQARIVTRYTLFADEVPLPAGGVRGDSDFQKDFEAAGGNAETGSLRRLDLKTRLLKLRCSYMIHSAVFAGLPPNIKPRVYREMAAALNVARPHPDFAYLPAAEKTAIRSILKTWLKDLPTDW